MSVTTSERSAAIDAVARTQVENAKRMREEIDAAYARGLEEGREEGNGAGIFGIGVGAAMASLVCYVARAMGWW